MASERKTLAVVAVMVIVAVVAIIAIRKSGSLEKFSYHFGFPVWGQTQRNLHRFGYHSPNHYLGITTDPSVRYVRAYDLYDRTRRSPSNRYVQPNAPTPRDRYNPFARFYTGYSNPFLGIGASYGALYRANIQPYLSSSCYSSTKTDSCVPGYEKVSRDFNGDGEPQSFQCCRI